MMRGTLLLRVVFAAALTLPITLITQCEAIAPRHSWSRAWGPMVPHSTFPGDCSTCHLPERWDELKEEFAFDHAAETGIPLAGAHQDAACLRCHNDRGPVGRYAERGCAGCHVDPHQASLGPSCEQCHHQSTWEPDGLFADHARTRFPLTGIHATAACESCHPRAPIQDFRATPVACDRCHLQDAQAAFPNHPLNGWTTDCERCHTPAGWGAPGFDHTAFPLQGGHAAPDCLQCHPNGRFAGLQTDCFACHQQDYLAQPDHVAQSFSIDCTECHDIFGFAGAGN